MQKKYFFALVTIISLLTLIGCTGTDETTEEPEAGEVEVVTEDGTDFDETAEVEDADAVEDVDEAGDDEEEPAEDEPAEDEPAATAPREIFVSGSEFKFNPSSISLTAGESVKVVFKNDGKYPHDFAIEGLGVKTSVIGAGEQAVLEFTAPATGTYATYCSVAGHREAGMEGVLSVQ